MTDGEHGLKSDVIVEAASHWTMGWPAGGAASEDGGRGWGHRGRRRRLRLRSFIFFILLLAEISTAVDAAAESDGYGESV